MFRRARSSELGGPVDEVATMLIGAQLRQGKGTRRVCLVITEVEAYAGPEDTASHARFGATARNAPMWGRAGHLYVYLC